jgi:hypothetical protein
VLEALGYGAPRRIADAKVPIRQSEFRPAGLSRSRGRAQPALWRPREGAEASRGSDAGKPLANKELKVHVLAAGAPVERVNDFHANLLSLLE